jgi:electron transfer flavoprotein beta subunit
MKILVAIKRVVDYNVRVQVKPDGSGVATDGVKMSINPFDEIAIEEALRIKEQGKADEVVVVTIGTNDSQQQLRTAMAMGADRAILVETDAAVQPLQAAQVLLKVIEEEQPGLVITGKQAIDDDNNQTPQMLATLWNRPQATFASKVEFVDGGLQVTREVDAGLETIQVELPAVVSTDLRLNEPRFVKLPDIMKAKRKPLDVKAIGDLAPELQGKAIEVTQHEAPQPRQKGIMVESVDELIDILKDKGLVS